MSISEEPRLRRQLGAAMDSYEPGPMRLEAIVADGRSILIRRRITVALCLVVVLVAASLIPLALRAPARPAPSSPLRYRVTVVPARPPDRPLVPTYGTTNSTPVASGWVDGRPWLGSLYQSGGNVGLGDGNVSLPGDGLGGPPAATRSGAPATIFSAEDSPYYWTDYGIVRSDVSYLHVRLTNGQVLTIWPVALFGPRYARYFAFAVPTTGDVTGIAAYSARGEIGYTLPFTLYGAYQAHWLSPGQPARPRPARYLIGQGTVRGGPWSAWVYAGPWGICQVSFFRRSGYPAAQCLPPRLSGRVAVALRNDLWMIGPLGWEEAGHLSPAIEVVQAAPEVSYLILTRADGTTFRVNAVRVGPARYCAFPTYYFLLSNRTGAATVVRWVAYDAAGQRLASGSALVR